MEKPKATYLDLMEIFFNRIDRKTLVSSFGPEIKILDMDKFIDSHIHILRGNPGNNTFRPYYERLFAMYKKNMV